MKLRDKITLRTSQQIARWYEDGLENNMAQIIDAIATNDDGSDIVDIMECDEEELLQIFAEYISKKKQNDEKFYEQNNRLNNEMEYVASDIQSITKSNKIENFEVTLFDNNNSLLYFLGDGNIMSIPFILDSWYTDVYDWIILKKQKIINEMYSHRDSIKRIN